ncbi:MAG: ABC transporter permease subunit, partial [Hyphomicrobiales bacterium]
MIREFSLNDLVFMLEALRWTVGLAIIATIGGGALGIIVAVLRVVSFKPANWLAIGYINLVQGTPLLGQLFVFFFGLPLFGITGVRFRFLLHNNTIWLVCFMGIGSG